MPGFAFAVTASKSPPAGGDNFSGNHGIIQARNKRHFRCTQNGDRPKFAVTDSGFPTLKGRAHRRLRIYPQSSARFAQGLSISVLRGESRRSLSPVYTHFHVIKPTTTVPTTVLHSTSNSPGLGRNHRPSFLCQVRWETEGNKQTDLPKKQCNTSKYTLVLPLPFAGTYRASRQLLWLLPLPAILHSLSRPRPRRRCFFWSPPTACEPCPAGRCYGTPLLTTNPLLLMPVKTLPRMPLPLWKVGGGGGAARGG